MLWEIQPSQWFDSGGNPLTALGNLRIEGTDVVLEGQMDSTGIVSQFGRFVMPLTRVGDVLQWALLALLEAGRGYLEVRAVAAGPTNTALALTLPLGPETWVKSDVRTVDIVPEQSYVSILGGTPGENVILRIKRLFLGDPQSIEQTIAPVTVAPGVPAGARLSAPFAATRLYGVGSPLAVGFDLLTLPFQIANVLVGFPPITIPLFGQPGEEQVQILSFGFTATGGKPTGEKGSHISFAAGSLGSVGVTASFTYRGPGARVRLALVDDQEPANVATVEKTLPQSITATQQVLTLSKPINTNIIAAHNFTVTLMRIDAAGNLLGALGSAVHQFPVYVAEEFGVPTFGF